MPDPNSPPPADPTRIAPAGPGGGDTTSGWQQPGGTVKSGGAPPPLPGGGVPGLPARIGRFEVRAVLGEGAFGRVYRGYDEALARDVAIKVPHGSAMTDGFRDRFLKEARAAATIHHPNVCPIYETGTDGGVPFLVIHFVAGPTLAAVLERRAGPFPLKQAAVVVRKLALGVAAAHAVGVVHRDLKPANVLVDDVRREVLITDFGVARVGDSGQTVDGEVIGTPAYMSPEQAMGKKGAVGPPSDVYSLGVILYRLLAGRTPYQGSLYEVLAQVYEGNAPPPRQFRPDLDPRLEAICQKAMAKDPGDRYRSAEALAEALDEYLRTRVPEDSGEQPALAPANARPAVAAPAAEEAVEAELAFDLPRAARPMLALMQAVAGAVFARGLGSLGRRVSEDGFAHEVAAEVIRRGRAAGPGGLAPMLAATAGANIADAQVAAAQAAWEVAARADEGDRMALEVYLGQLPDAIRKAFKRADDPTGTSVPRAFRADAPSVLAAVFPRRVPRFRGGQAVPGRPDWTLVRWLGAGGFGEVWLAQHRRVGNLFGAVKFGLDLTPGQRAKLAREAQTAAQALTAHPHPSLVPLLDSDLRGDAPWLMYEYVGGGDLADLVLAWQVLPPAGRVRAVAERLREVAEALAAPHRMAPPAVHRDLKPSNILRDPHTFRLRVTDFGAGGAAVDGQVRRRAEGADEFRGAHSLLYASPQQLRGDPPDPRDDVHALGVLGYQMLTGRLTAGVPADYAQVLRGLGVPPAFVQLIGACSAADAAARPRDARALLPLLAPHAADPVLPPSGGPAPRPSPSAVVFEIGDDKAAGTEVLVCPVCRARLQVAAGRTVPVPCPKCSTKFSPAAGRAALKVKSRAAEPLSLDDAPEPDPPPPPRPPRRPARPAPAAAPPRPRSYRRLLSCGLFLALAGGLTAAGLVHQDELTAWVEGRRPRPVEFVTVREFEPGSDKAQVYALLSHKSDRPNLLLTNADRKDVLAAVWDLTAGRRAYVLKGKTNQPAAAIDPKVTQFRYRAGDNKLAVFDREADGRGRGGVLVYDLPGEPDDEPPAGAAPDGLGGREVTAVAYAPQLKKGVWDVSGDLTRAVSEPKGPALTLWKLPEGAAVKELSAKDRTFRAVAFTADGRHVVGLFDESYVQVWDAETGAESGGKVRLAIPAVEDGSGPLALAVDNDLTRITVSSNAQVGSWDLKTGKALAPVKKATDGVLLRHKYRLRTETAGPGSFSVFHDEFTLRAARHATADNALFNAPPVLSDDLTTVAAAWNRKVQVWKLKYAPEAK